jgi:hypothetical protein
MLLNLPVQKRPMRINRPETLDVDAVAVTTVTNGKVFSSRRRSPADEHRGLRRALRSVSPAVSAGRQDGDRRPHGDVGKGMPVWCELFSMSPAVQPWHSPARAAPAAA